MHQNPFAVGPPEPAGEAYDAPSDTLVGWGGGHPSPFPSPRRLRRLASEPPYSSIRLIPALQSQHNGRRL